MRPWTGVYVDRRFGTSRLSVNWFRQFGGGYEFSYARYTTSGFVTHAGRGALPPRALDGVNASGYLIEPAGQQTVISRVVTVQRKTAASSNSSAVTTATKNLPAASLRHSQKPVFETTTVTTGSAYIARPRLLNVADVGIEPRVQSLRWVYAALNMT
jgi:hypothetical protein